MRRRAFGRAILGALVALALAAPGPAEVLDSAPDGFSLQNTVEVGVDAETAWRALVEDVDAWWPADHTWWGAEATLSIEPRAGGCFCERLGGREAQHLLVTFAEPSRLLRLTGGLGPLQGMGLDGVLEFRLEPSETGTRVTMFYRAGGYTPDDLAELAPVVDGVQALQLQGLAAHLAAR